MINSSKRLVAMLICLALVLSMLPMSVFAAGTTTVYYYNNNGWSTVLVHYWGSPSVSDTTWPGTAMTDLGNGYWSIDVPSDASGLLFNNGSGSQTGDQKVPTGDNNCYAGGTWGPYTGGTIEIKKATVYVDAAACGWSTAYAYFWGGSDSCSWPGIQMTAVKDGIYSIELSPDTANIIFNNGNSGDGNQTSDLVFPGDGMIWNGTAFVEYATYGECAHANTTDLAAVEATCTTAGKTAGKVCADCGYVTVPQEEIPALGHTTTVEGETCTVCGLTMEYITVYFENNWLFGNLKVHYWGSAIANTTWPGVAVEVFTTTPADEYGNTKDVYAAKVPADIDGLLFNGTDNDNGSERKTPDITEFAEDQVYYMNWTEELGEHVCSYDLSNLIPTCNHEYLYACDAHCMHCGELTNENAAHSIIHVEAVEATCQATGNIEYWTCEYCNGCWDNAEATGMPLNAMSVKTYADHEYFYPCDPYCMNCYELTNEDAAHSIIHVDAVAPTCETIGNIEYWYCEYCGTCWDNADATGMPLNQQSVKLPVSHNVVHIEAVEPGCHYTGNVEHWYCTECDIVWTDEAQTQISNHKSVILPATGGDVVHVEAVDATCSENGNIEHWYCESCEQFWADEALTQLTNSKNVIIGATGEHEYFYACDAHCMNCGELTNENASHSMTHVAAVEGDCSTMGNIEYWTCEHCNGCWDNENGTGMPLNRFMVLTGYGDHNVVDGVCTICGATSDIKWQVTKGTNAESATTDLRLITYVDSLDYSGITFKVTVNGKTVDYTCYTVYTTILAGGQRIEDAAKTFGNENAKYFVTYSLTGVPAAAFDSEIQVEVVWTDLDGFEIEGVGRTIVISDYYA